MKVTLVGPPPKKSDRESRGHRNPQRSLKLQKKVRRSLRRSGLVAGDGPRVAALQAPAIPPESARVEQIRPALPAKSGDLRPSAVEVPPPVLTGNVIPAATAFATFWRIWIWIWAVVKITSSRVLDVVTGRDTLRRRALRFRMTLQGLGPTFIKVGQQLAVRADVLPEEYCEELLQMLDKVPPMPFSQVENVIRRQTGGRIDETFRDFESKPIGAASLACVYRAKRMNGETVAVKIMRPGVAKRMMEEMRALGWLSGLIESLGFVREGMLSGIYQELNVMLKEELDFRREARNAELFRLGAEELKEDWFTAPEVHWDLIGREMIVFEFVDGMTIGRLIEIIETEDAEGLALIKELDIDANRVAKYLARALHWELNEAILFHGDPHPANIMVRPGGQLVFIDFGSCGKMSTKFRRTWQQFYGSYARSDVSAMVEGVLRLLEPLPPLDVDTFAKALELVLWDYIHAGRSKHSTWQERSSGVLWMRFASIAREHTVPMTVEAIRLFRATFLYDTALFRLWGGESSTKGDPAAAYMSYLRTAGKRAKKRVLRATRRRMMNGLQPEDYLRIEEVWRFGEQSLNTLQHLIDMPQASLRDMVSALGYSLSLMLKLAGASVLGLSIYGIYVILSGSKVSIFGFPLDGLNASKPVSVIAICAAAFFSLTTIRKLLFRLGEPTQSSK